MPILSTLDIRIARGAAPDADLVFTSIDANGNPGELNRYVLRQLNLLQDSLPKRSDLANGYAIQNRGAITLVYVVTVGENAVEENLRRNLSAALQALDIRAGQRLWIPLMGTGAGRLAVLQSLNPILDALESDAGKLKAGTRITIAVPDKLSQAESSALELTLRRRAGTSAGPRMEGGSGAAAMPLYSYGADVSALMTLANRLAPLRRTPSDRISSSLLMFSIASRSFQKSWGQLDDPAPVRHFSDALRSLAGPGFDAAWERYFPNEGSLRHRGGPGSNASQSANSPSGPGASSRSGAISGASSGSASSTGLAANLPLTLTSNVLHMFKVANDKALAAGRTVLTLGDLIEALLALPSSGFINRLEEMGLSLTQLVSAYRQRMPEQAQRSLDRSVVYDFLLADRATSEDRMHFKHYAAAIANFLRSADTVGPISISIQAPWGAGKSSLMQQVRKALDPACEHERKSGHATTRRVVRFLNQEQSRMRSGLPSPPPAAPPLAEAVAPPPHWTVWFNAWKYESSEQVWAGLVDAIVSQVSDRLDPVEREIFLLRLNLARIDDTEVRKKIYDKLATYWWAGARWLLAIAAAVPAVLMWLAQIGPVWAGISTLGAAGAGMTGWLWRAWKKVLDEPATFSLAQYVRVPDYGKSVGVVHQIHQDLQRIVSLLPTSQAAPDAPPVTLPLVIFVDDLDRCTPGKVANIVEGINTFLAGDQREFMFVIGMDPQIVAAALEHAHKDVKSQLPRYEQQAPLGWRFMDKFVQLAFTIPPPRNATIQEFVRGLTLRAHSTPATPVVGADQPLPENRTSPPEHEQADPAGAATETLALQQELSKTVTNESEDVHAVLAGITGEFQCSGREVKRILNFIRFVLLLRIGRIAGSEPVPPLESYQRWIFLCIRWPEVVRWLQWGAGAITASTDTQDFEGLTAQRLSVLEDAASESDSQRQAWTKRAATRLGLPEAGVAWLEDPELHRFFVGEARRKPEERLSRSASTGFY